MRPNILRPERLYRIKGWQPTHGKSWQNPGALGRDSTRLSGLTLEPASRQIVFSNVRRGSFPVQKRSDNSGSGMIIPKRPNHLLGLRITTSRLAPAMISRRLVLVASITLLQAYTTLQTQNLQPDGLKAYRRAYVETPLEDEFLVVPAMIAELSDMGSRLSQGRLRSRPIQIS